MYSLNIYCQEVHTRISKITHYCNPSQAQKRAWKRTVVVIVDMSYNAGNYSLVRGFIGLHNKCNQFPDREKPNNGQANPQHYLICVTHDRELLDKLPYEARVKVQIL